MSLPPLTDIVKHAAFQGLSTEEKRRVLKRYNEVAYPNQQEPKPGYQSGDMLTEVGRFAYHTGAELVGGVKSLAEAGIQGMKSPETRSKILESSIPMSPQSGEAALKGLYNLPGALWQGLKATGEGVAKDFGEGDYAKGASKVAATILPIKVPKTVSRVVNRIPHQTATGQYNKASRLINKAVGLDEGYIETAEEAIRLAADDLDFKVSEKGVIGLRHAVDHASEQVGTLQEQMIAAVPQHVQVNTVNAVRAFIDALPDQFKNKPDTVINMLEELGVGNQGTGIRQMPPKQAASLVTELRRRLKSFSKEDAATKKAPYEAFRHALNEDLINAVEQHVPQGSFREARMIYGALEELKDNTPNVSERFAQNEAAGWRARVTGYDVGHAAASPKTGMAHALMREALASYKVPDKLVKRAFKHFETLPYGPQPVVGTVSPGPGGPVRPTATPMPPGGALPPGTPPGLPASPIQNRLLQEGPLGPPRPPIPMPAAPSTAIVPAKPRQLGPSPTPSQSQPTPAMVPSPKEPALVTAKTTPSKVAATVAEQPTIEDFMKALDLYFPDPNKPLVRSKGGRPTKGVVLATKALQSGNIPDEVKKVLNERYGGALPPRTSAKEKQVQRVLANKPKEVPLTEISRQAAEEGIGGRERAGVATYETPESKLLEKEADALGSLGEADPETLARSIAEEAIGRKLTPEDNLADIYANLQIKQEKGLIDLQKVYKKVTSKEMLPLLITAFGLEGARTVINHFKPNPRDKQMEVFE